MFKSGGKLSVACGLFAVCAQVFCALGAVYQSANIENKTEFVAKIYAQVIKNLSICPTENGLQKNAGQPLRAQRPNFETSLFAASIEPLADISSQCNLWEIPFANFESDTEDFFINDFSQGNAARFSGAISALSTPRGKLPPIRAPSILS